MAKMIARRYAASASTTTTSSNAIEQRDDERKPERNEFYGGVEGRSFWFAHHHRQAGMTIRTIDETSERSEPSGVRVAPNSISPSSSSSSSSSPFPYDENTDNDDFMTSSPKSFAMALDDSFAYSIDVNYDSIESSFLAMPDMGSLSGDDERESEILLRPRIRPVEASLLEVWGSTGHIPPSSCSGTSSLLLPRMTASVDYDSMGMP